jgi:prepilin-type N-terminal cleavage/methylation domain-containing protein
MTTTTARRRGSRPGFTLAEITVAAAVAGILIAGVLSTWVFSARSQFTLLRYEGMAREARRALELFGRDARMASDITSFSATNVILVIPGSGSSTTAVTYAYDAGTRSFTRTAGGQTRVLVRNVQPDFAFSRFRIDRAPASNILETKQLAIRLTASFSTAGQATATHRIFSARFVLRNKHVTS